jgi:hypothetical protein
VELVVLKGSVKLPRMMRGELGQQIVKGQTLPSGYLSPEEVERLLKAGILGAVVEPVSAAAKLPPTRGKWCRDPADLAGMSTLELLTAVAEIDPNCPVLHGGEELGEAALVQLLTADFEPVFRAPEPSTSVDRNRPPEGTLARARGRAKGV